ncbi:legumain-like isoform X1 [Cyprinus carpio]|uniref:legumain n=2 Tax=Cyprinus carpio TaxID=7962 RepID=A0A8C1MG67_CYPCA|nr:legumain-like isoform X1 [Cyprinus carpio]
MGGANGKQWVMLVAGSKSWKNYRHQADVCHAYQIVHQNGIPDEQIVVMMYDDIAYNAENPYPGKIINKPNGPNVYPNVPKDYTGKEVTPENFLAALKGDSSAVKKSNPKVITSGGNDTLFIYLSDHGGSNTFCFPKGTLHAHDLIETIKEMARNYKFSKMVIYMESCESGSMFTTLPDNVHVYAVTSARAHENGYACYFDSVRKTYLSDEFSAVWMHYTEANDLDKKTFRDQFSYLQEKMQKSHSCRFGDKTMCEDPISVFVKYTPQSVQDKTRAEELALTHLTSNDEVPFKILEHRIRTETDAGKRQYLIRKQETLHQTKAKIEGTVKAIKQQFPGFALEGDLDDDYSQMDLHAFKTVAEHFRTTCFDWHEEEFQMALSHTHVFARLCARGVEAERIKAVITAVSRGRRFLQ